MRGVTFSRQPLTERVGKSGLWWRQGCQCAAMRRNICERANAEIRLVAPASTALSFRSKHLPHYCREIAERLCAVAIIS